MGTNLHSLPTEIMQYTANYLKLDEYIQLRSTGWGIRQNLGNGSSFVKVGRLLFRFCEY